MSRQKQRGRRQRGTPIRAWVYGGLGLLLLAVIGGTGIYFKSSERPVDRETGCPADAYDSITVALIDLTDPVNPVRAAALRNALLKVRNEVPKFGRFEIYPLEPITTATIQPLFAGCSPGSGRDVDSRLYGNPELADRLWSKLYGSKVDAVIARISNLPPQDSSPILEGIQSVAVTAFGTPEAGKAIERRIVLFSDMIHHTSGMSMYGGAPPFEDFKEGQYYRRVKPSLRGANVDVFLIVRETRKDVQQPPLYRFWVEQLADGGGYLRYWDPLQ